MKPQLCEAALMIRQERIPRKAPISVALALSVVVLSGCMNMRGGPGQDSFVLFFVPGTTQLDPDAQQIVKQAAFRARMQKPMRIEIAVPPDTPGGLKLVEGRMTAIQNVLSVEGADPKLYVRGAVAEQAVAIPAAANRAEIRLIR
jgi:hypothetical protein